MAELEIFEAIHSARSLRKFKPDPVPDEIITQILDAAIRAPSASSNQNWVFVVVRDAGQRKRLGEIYYKASRVLMAEYGERKRPEHLEERQFNLMRKSSSYLFEHMAEAPVLLVAALASGKSSRFSPLSHEQETNRLWRTSGASIYPAVQNIILAARALGLGTVLTTIHTY
ncbi:MAG: nitroreductase family protein, partial [Candidatus Binataceae bacterium]